MASEQAKAVYQRRMGLIEPAFGIIKEQMGVRRFLLRGLRNVQAEWTLVAIAFNLRTLWRLRGPGVGLRPLQAATLAIKKTTSHASAAFFRQLWDTILSLSGEGPLPKRHVFQYEQCPAF